MSAFKKATTLNEVYAAVDLEPLGWGDPRYVDVSRGRGSNTMDRLRACLSMQDSSKDQFAKIAFTGHKGSGKSTELLRLEHEFDKKFTSLHINIDDSLISDLDYTDLFLWLVDRLVRQFDDAGTPLDVELVEEVVNWFAEVTLADVQNVKKEVELEASAKAEGKAGFFWLSVGLLAKLTSRVKGSLESRKEIRRKLQRDSLELLRRVNLLLDNAHKVLEAKQKPRDLLIVVDNLDRLEPEVSFPLFFKNGDFLKQLRAHMIYTVPIASRLAPNNIGTIFKDRYSLSMVKVRDRDGERNRTGIHALEEAIAHRVEIPAVFANRKKNVQALAEMSGGSVRDLMRLISTAQLIALANGKAKIDTEAVNEAIRSIRLEQEQNLMPGAVFYPLLAQIHVAKSDIIDLFSDPDPQSVKNNRDTFNELLRNGYVFEYNGETMWYDVHPLIEEIKAFQRALADVQDPPPSQGQSST